MIKLFPYLVILKKFIAVFFKVILLTSTILNTCICWFSNSTLFYVF